jgi:thioredoxin reductase
MHALAPILIIGAGRAGTTAAASRRNPTLALRQRVRDALGAHTDASTS